MIVIESGDIFECASIRASEEDSLRLGQ